MRIYKKLDPSIGYTYILEDISQEDKMWIFKARSDLIELNGTRFQTNLNTLCSMCNMNEVENLQHFLGRCMALKQFRKNAFDKVLLTEEELINVLNGHTVKWKDLANFIKVCIHYRKQLIFEFNF